MERQEKSNFLPRDRWLNFASILAPAAWVLHLNISYMLVPETCGDGTKMILHIVTAACIAVALIAAAIAWTIRAVTIDRAKWTATMGFCLSLVMIVVIIAQEIPNVMLRSCD